MVRAVDPTLLGPNMYRRGLGEFEMVRIHRSYISSVLLFASFCSFVESSQEKGDLEHGAARAPALQSWHLRRCSRIEANL